MTPSTSAARVLDSRGMRPVNPPAVEEIRRQIQMALPYGSHEAIAARSGCSVRAVQHQIEGDNALTLAVFVAALAALPESDRLRIARKALAPARLIPASLPSGRLLPAITPAAASTFPILGHLVEAAALAEADKVVTREEADAIREEAEKATALLASIATTAEVAAGQGLA